MSFYQGNSPHQPLHYGQEQPYRSFTRGDPRYHQQQQQQQQQYVPPTTNPYSNVTPSSPGAESNPLLFDDDAFRNAAETLLNKRRNSCIPGERYIYTKMYPKQRSQFAAAFARRHRLKVLPMFPEPDETMMDRWMRRIIDEFGTAFLKVVPDEAEANASKATQHYRPEEAPRRGVPSPQQHAGQHRHDQYPQYQQHHGGAPTAHHYPTPLGPQQGNYQNQPTDNNYQRHDEEYRQQAPPAYQERRYRQEDNQHHAMVHKPQNAGNYSNYSIPQRNDPPMESHYPGNGSHFKHQQQPRHHQQEHYPPHHHHQSPRGRSQSFESSSRSEPPSPANVPTPTSILRKETRVMREAPQVRMEAVMMPPKSPKAAATTVAKNQSSTRQVLMQEIEYTAKLLNETSVTTSDRQTYQSHLTSLKRRLESLTTTGSKHQQHHQASSDGILEIQEVLAPKVVDDEPMIAEIDQIMPPEQQRTLQPRRTSRSRSPSRFRSRSRSRERPRQSAGVATAEYQGGAPLEAREEDIPRVVSFEKPIEYHDDESRSSILAETPASSLLRVVAPSDLPGGYQLEVELENNRVVLVTVPAGGVGRGQVFASVATEMAEVNYDRTSKSAVQEQHASTAKHSVTSNQTEVQYQNWKGGIFDCFAYGIDHPMFCHSFFFPQVALTQIMTRMKLSNYGERRTSPNARMRIKTVVFLSSCYFFLNLLLICTMIWTPNIAAKVFSCVVFGLGNGPAMFAFCHVVVQTRRSIRSAYSIPESRCEGYEDLLVSVWCTPCTIAQMMHQTADYDTYRAVWFSESGLPHHVMTEAPAPTQRNTNVSLI